MFSYFSMKELWPAFGILTKVPILFRPEVLHSSVQWRVVGSPRPIRALLKYGFPVLNSFVAAQDVASTIAIVVYTIVKAFVPDGRDVTTCAG